MLIRGGRDRVVGGLEFVLMIVIVVEGGLSVGENSWVKDLHGSLCVNRI